MSSIDRTLETSGKVSMSYLIRKKHRLLTLIRAHNDNSTLLRVDFECLVRFPITRVVAHLVDVHLVKIWEEMSQTTITPLGPDSPLICHFPVTGQKY